LYFDDAEPQGVYDAALTGKARTLLGYCRVFGWQDLVTAVENLIPIQCNAPSALEEIQGFLIPEARQRLANVSPDDEGRSDLEFWQLIHPRIRHLARPRVESGFYGDAIESSFKEVNHSVKRLVKEKANKDADGSGLMTLAFSPSNPIIALADLHTESGRNIQQGFMQIYSGSMTGIRNPQEVRKVNLIGDIEINVDGSMRAADIADQLDGVSNGVCETIAVELNISTAEII
jgi:uncharacterized protein (TIGR02391 family)